ncbi:hypothetical protein [Vibrio gazogenes]|uniref:Uncharacterized protein n=1 Tax=Vibrio gazogenes DSM 21264 = NBRC 103151 TaxID=1123492 RepID=A0A1M4UQJ6_VIBGA|nr:hypothetical protein [Vibrio gazogenes]USP15707.1 hypothetical protein MKS89_20190 [Vibrio gazogenes]SHE59022.1 hypothetical protein SAMN02745781_00535 [Vibrio gazogenes DSM 21264] [Vibrio gazogenes DSM 21264 = NBRC 103151]SJN56194.1 hypothetical protein BQ6471_01929 [Vibrio gazogenes]
MLGQVYRHTLGSSCEWVSNDLVSLSQQECLKLCTELEKKPRLWVGSTEQLNLAKQQLKKQRMLGIHIS